MKKNIKTMSIISTILSVLSGKTKGKNISIWLNEIAQSESLDANINALYFGLYETAKGYCIYLAGCKDYNAEDDDWACEPVYKSENIFEIESKLSWQEVLQNVCFEIKSAIANRPDTPLFANRVVCVGFDDGDVIRIQ